jgi:hypothetical protein
MISVGDGNHSRDPSNCSIMRKSGMQESQSWFQLARSFVAGNQVVVIVVVAIVRGPYVNRLVRKSIKVVVII